MNNEKYNVALFKAWEKDEQQVLTQGRLDAAYELGFLAAWNTRHYPPANDTDMVVCAAKAIHNARYTEETYQWGALQFEKREYDEGIKLAQAALTALQSAGYRITREGV